MTYSCLKAARRLRGLGNDWESWLTAADELYCRYLDQFEISPFSYHEVAAVGFLAAAAARADFLPLAEYEIVKRSSLDRRFKVSGRADLWLQKKHRSYSFEFKKAFPAATTDNLSARLEKARLDIGNVGVDECNFGAGVLIAYVRDEHRRDIYRSFAENPIVDAAYQIGPDGIGGGYLFFSIKDQ